MATQSCICATHLRNVFLKLEHDYDKVIKGVLKAQADNISNNLSSDTLFFNNDYYYKQNIPFCLLQQSLIINLVLSNKSPIFAFKLLRKMINTAHTWFTCPTQQDCEGCPLCVLRSQISRMQIALSIKFEGVFYLQSWPRDQALGLGPRLRRFESC